MLIEQCPFQKRTNWTWFVVSRNLWHLAHEVSLNFIETLSVCCKLFIFMFSMDHNKAVLNTDFNFDEIFDLLFHPIHQVLDSILKSANLYKYCLLLLLLLLLSKCSEKNRKLHFYSSAVCV